MRAFALSLSFAFALVAAGCEADQETFEAGGTLEAPSEVQEAPAVPFPSTPEATQGPQQPGGATTPPMGMDSAAMPDSVQPAPPQ